MKYWLTLGVILLLAVSVPLLSAVKGDAAAGKVTFAKRCASCHGAAGEGKEAIAKMMKVEMRPLGSKEVQAKSDADLRKVMVDGTGKMKPVTPLTDGEVANLIAYIRSLAKK